MTCPACGGSGWFTEFKFLCRYCNGTGISKYEKKEEIKMKKVTIYFYITSNGDGSASLRYFDNETARNAYGDACENSDSFEGFTDNDTEVTLLVDDEGKFTLDSKHQSLNPVFGEK